MAEGRVKQKNLFLVPVAYSLEFLCSSWVAPRNLATSTEAKRNRMSGTGRIGQWRVRPSVSYLVG